MPAGLALILISSGLRMSLPIMEGLVFIATLSISMASDRTDAACMATVPLLASAEGRAPTADAEAALGARLPADCGSNRCRARWAKPCATLSQRSA